MQGSRSKETQVGKSGVKQECKPKGRSRACLVDRAPPHFPSAM